jgi:hypothetical protein
VGVAVAHADGMKKYWTLFWSVAVLAVVADLLMRD